MNDDPEGTARENGHLDSQSDAGGALLSDEPTVELLIKAKAGDSEALEAILQRCLPPLKKWAHGRLPSEARGVASTDDLVQSAASHVIARLDKFHPQHVGAMQAYLRRSVINDIRDRIRQIRRRPTPVELPEDLASSELSPLEHAMVSESYERYLAALRRLRPRDRELIVARIEAQWTVEEVAERFGFHSPDAARMAVLRSVRRLRAEIDTQLPTGGHGE